MGQKPWRGSFYPGWPCIYPNQPDCWGPRHWRLEERANVWKSQKQQTICWQCFNLVLPLRYVKPQLLKAPPTLMDFFLFFLIRYLLEQPDMSETKQNINLHRILTISFSFLVNWCFDGTMAFLKREKKKIRQSDRAEPILDWGCRHSFWGEVMWSLWQALSFEKWTVQEDVKGWTCHFWAVHWQAGRTQYSEKILIMRFLIWIIEPLHIEWREINNSTGPQQCPVWLFFIRMCHFNVSTRAEFTATARVAVLC